MSDTPISDSTPHNVADLGMLCRRLERQLNAANDRIKRLIRERDEARAERDEAAKVVEKALSELGQVARSRCALIDRIKRLEEALYKIEFYAATGILQDSFDEIKRIAKEAKL